MGSFSLKHPRLLNLGFACLGGLCAVVVSFAVFQARGRSPASTASNSVTVPMPDARLCLPILD